MSEVYSDGSAGTRQDHQERPRAPGAIELEDLGFSYPDGHRALEGITLRIEAGERVAILGPNGAGKSTLCLHLNGILEATEGTVSVCGLPIFRADDVREIRRRVGVVFQDPDDMLFMPTVHMGQNFLRFPSPRRRYAAGSSAPSGRSGWGGWEAAPRTTSPSGRKRGPQPPRC